MAEEGSPKDACEKCVFVYLMSGMRDERVLLKRVG